MSFQKVALVTGANRGIGYATVKALLKKFQGSVYLTSRNQALGEEAVASLANEGLNPKYHVLDISDNSSIASLKDYMIKNYGGVDVLVHNVGIMYPPGDKTPFPEQAKNLINTNYLNASDVCTAFLPHMKSEGRMVLMSAALSLLSLKGCSEDVQTFFKSNDLTEEILYAKMNDYIDSAAEGTVKQKGFHTHAYGMSKLAVNALTRVLAKRAGDFGQSDILVNCCCPGWVRTSMGGPKAPLSPDQGAQIPAMLALLPKGSVEPNGEFYQRRKFVKWY